MTKERTDKERVVITGLGAITPLGLTVEETWQGLIAGRSGVDFITRFDASHLPTRIAAEVKDFDPKDYMDFKLARRIARCSQLVIAAGQQAMLDADLLDSDTPKWDNPERVGVLIGSAIGGFDEAERGIHIIRDKGWKRLSPFILAASLPNIPAHHLSHTYGTKGYISTIATACASSSQAIGEATEIIRRGAADIIISGGTEAMICEATICGFIAMRAMSCYNEEPKKASRPFDKNRDGFVIGEGSGIVILESLAHAKARGAHIYAEVLGQASSSDAYHVAAPDPKGEGALRVMRWALEDAGLTPDDVDYINAHATATPAGDVVETIALKKLFGERAYQVPISATKSMIGHTLGAAGVLEGIACIMSIRHNVVHPTINYETPDPECDLDYVPNKAREVPVNIVVSNSFGFGGQNACLVFGRYSDDSGRP